MRKSLKDLIVLMPIIVIILVIILQLSGGLWVDYVDIEPINDDEATTEQVSETKLSETVDISCYTGWESHGKNGITDGVSVATHKYPQGTWLEIEGIGTRRVDTITAERLAHRVDVWWGSSQDDYRDCLRFGVQKRAVTVIK